MIHTGDVKATCKINLQKVIIVCLIAHMNIVCEMLVARFEFLLTFKMYDG